MNQPDSPQVIEQIAAYLHISPDQIECIPIRHGTFERNNVWRLNAGERSFILKQHLIAEPVGESTFTPFQVESAILLRLHQARCRVPELYWWSDAASYLLMEWCGDTTLDDLAQKTPTGELNPILQNTVRAFCQLEEGFAKTAHALNPYIYPLDYSVFLQDMLQTLLDQGRKTLDYLAWMRGEPIPADQAAGLDAIWTRMSDCLHRATPTLGTLDYNARNIVVNGDTPTFIDFGSIGWDWSERRLVQSLNSLGANRTNGNFVSLLEQEVVKEYAGQVSEHREDCSETEITAQVDYHQLLFYLSIIHRLLQSTAQPEEAESKATLQAWGDPKARFQRALALIINSHLSEDPDTKRLRELTATFRDASN
ncbi:aminoglycoside phosphotransferase family protein [Candidatus Poribacteria bacterium]|nr:aminoglycoside phosphotransferase family protein [Candidatus Poribacteria bacterium]